jgi:hypothetical protein
MCDDNLVRKRYGTGRVERAKKNRNLTTKKCHNFNDKHRWRLLFYYFRDFIKSEKRCLNASAGEITFFMPQQQTHTNCDN